MENLSVTTLLFPTSYLAEPVRKNEKKLSIAKEIMKKRGKNEIVHSSIITLRKKIDLKEKNAVPETVRHSLVHFDANPQAALLEAYSRNTSGVYKVGASNAADIRSYRLRRFKLAALKRIDASSPLSVSVASVSPSPT